MFREFLTRNTRVKLTRKIYSERPMGEESYRLVVSSDGVAEISFSSVHGRRYAEEALAGLTSESGTLVCEVEDYPSLSIRGIIEGFYGKPYSQNQRKDVIDFIASHRMNAYFYAPKDDLFHRDRWREAYPDDALNCLSALIAYAKEKGVRFYFCLSPGKDFAFSQEEEYALLMRKFEQVQSIGAEDFALLFDDIPNGLSKEDGLKFSSAGEAHSYVANFINRNLTHCHELVFCPTDYFQNTDTPYRQAVKAHLDGDVQVFWTGYNTVAEALPAVDCKATKDSFGHPLILWDNYPVNDFNPKQRVYFGAVCNRTRNLADFHNGCVANPSALWESSKIALSSMAEWMWNPEAYDEDAAYERAVKEYLGDSAEARFFADLNRSSVLRRYPDNEDYFRSEDWQYLDAYYAQYERALEKMRARCKAALFTELSQLFRWCKAECALYHAMRAGKPTQPLLEEMETLSMRTADQSLLRYLARRGGKDITFAEREVYWATERRKNL